MVKCTFTGFFFFFNWSHYSHRHLWNACHLSVRKQELVVNWCPRNMNIWISCFKTYWKGGLGVLRTFSSNYICIQQLLSTSSYVSRFGVWKRLFKLKHIPRRILIYPLYMPWALILKFLHTKMVLLGIICHKSNTK